MGCKPLDKPKQKHKKGLWSPDEDQKLRSHIMKYGHGCWSSVPVNAGLQRNGKSCRLRWINYLRPGLKRGAFSFEEEEKILKLHQTLGNKWSQIAHHLPGRTDNEIKNYWHSHLKKRVSKRAETEAQVKNACTNGQIQGSELSPSSPNATPQTIFGAFKNMDAFESVPQLIEQSKGIQKCNLLPKVVFAEWLSLDQFQDLSYGSGVDFKCTVDNNSNSEDSLIHDPMLYEGAFGSEVHPKSGGGSVDDILQSSFKFEDQMSEIGLVDYFPGEFNMNCDDMYI